jgi:hypothetical protein
VKRGAWHKYGLALGCSCLVVPVLAEQPIAVTPPELANYMLNCMGCHIADGSGAAGKVPSVRDSLVPLAMSSAGRRYLIQVPGVAQSSLSDRELARLLGWMVRNLSAQAVPPNFVEFSAAEVASYRKSPLVNVGETRARVLAGGTGAVGR